jgi:hypothetical protein
MDIIIYGDKGSGKTLMSIVFCEIERKKDNTTQFFTNTDYKYKTGSILDYLKKENQNKNYHKILLFDEIDKYIDARGSMSSINKFIVYIMSLSRKTNTDIIMTSQLLRSIDLKAVKFANLIIQSNLLQKPEKENGNISILNLDILTQDNYNTYSKIVKINPDVLKLYDTNYLLLGEISEDLKKIMKYYKDNIKIKN